MPGGVGRISSAAVRGSRYRGQIRGGREREGKGDGERKEREGGRGREEGAGGGVVREMGLKKRE